MKSCWEVLGIQRTTDLEVIQRARRSLMKRWHPDTITVPEEKHSYTVRCMDINAAFEEAASFAKRFQPVRSVKREDKDLPNPASTSDCGIFRETYDSLSPYQRVTAVSLVLFLFAFQTFFFVFVTLAFLAVLIGGTLLMAVVDFVFVRLILKPLQFLASPVGSLVNKHEKTLLWLSLLILNFLVVNAWLSGFGTSIFGALLGRVLSASLALGIPSGLLFNWYKEGRLQSL